MESKSHQHPVTMHPPGETASETAKRRYREVLKVTLIGSAFDLILGVAKIVGGFLSTSTALIADGVHSLSDLFTDFIVIYAAKHSHREADAEHPYGHGRIETLATWNWCLKLCCSFWLSASSMERNSPGAGLACRACRPSTMP